MNRHTFFLLLFIAGLPVACAETPLPVAVAVAAAQPPAPPATASPAVDDGFASRGLKRVVAGSPAPSPPDWSRTFASLYTLVETREGTWALAQDGARLHTGDKISFHLRVGRAAWVYLVQTFPDGQTVILYPSEDEPQQLAAGVDHRIPTDLRVSFQLDQTIGTEEVLLIAADRPLGTGEQNLTSFVSFVRSNHRPPPVRPRNIETLAADPTAGPTSAGVETRGLRRVTGSSGRALDVDVDSSGVAVATLHFLHLP